MALAVYGVAVVVAPALGPALGGWITDTFSWRWIFFINVPVGILSLSLTWLLVRDSENAKKEHEKATRGHIKVDYAGFALVAIGLGFLQIVLDKGQEDDWFSSPFITGCALLSGIGIAGAIIWELWVSEAPIVDLPLMGDRSFLFTNFMMFSTLFILMSTTQILPQFVQQILPYDATHAGLTLMPGGLVIMALMPLVGFLVRKIQPKYLIAFGFLVMALALNDFGNFYGAISFQTIALARVFQGFGFAFLFVPIQTLALSDVPAGKSNNASALINLMRNLGGSVGISVATTCLARRSQVHQDRLAAHLTPTAIRYQAHVHILAQRFSAHGADTFTAAGRALATMGAEMQTQAALLAYLDIFALLMFGSLFACLLTCFLKKVKPGRKPAH